MDHAAPRHARYDSLLNYLWIFTVCLALLGFVLDSPENILKGLIAIVMTEDALITDYFLVAGPGAALVNSALVTSISLVLLRLSGDTLNGMTLVEVGLMSGFSLFGKNYLNIWPILLGSWLYPVSRKEPYGSYVGIGLMATALSPVISYIALDNGWGSVPLGIIVGIVIGYIMAPLAAYTYRIQNGMNLYNVGFSCGLVAFICVPLMSGFGATPETKYRWAGGYDLTFALVLGISCLLLILCGLLICGIPIWAAWAGYRMLLNTSGRAPSDYLRMFGPAPVLINTGVNGLIGTAFILLGGGDLNGPTIGGILTIMGFSAFGKHARNIIPVMAGVFLGSALMHWKLSDPAVQLACLFCTTLAPVSGYFGWPYGVLAGFLHSSVVLFTSTPVAGMNLYNNGFSGGMVAIVLYPLLIAIARHRKPVLQDGDLFENLENDSPVMAPDRHTIIEEKDE